jgi:hypothetical protein
MGCVRKFLTAPKKKWHLWGGIILGALSAPTGCLIAALLGNPWWMAGGLALGLLGVVLWLAAIYAE